MILYTVPCSTVIPSPFSLTYYLTISATVYTVLIWVPETEVQYPYEVQYEGRTTGFATLTRPRDGDGSLASPTPTARATRVTTFRERWRWRGDAMYCTR